MECSCGAKSEEGKHTYGEWVTTKDPTKETTGTKERECSVCHYKETGTIDKLHSHSVPENFNKWDKTNHWKECECGEKSEQEKHSFGEWVTTKDPTEETTGTKERECSVCHYIETGTVDKLDHQHKYLSFNKWDETNHWKECSCGEKSEEEAHTYGEWVTTKNPTEDTKGTMERECSVCHYKEEKDLDVEAGTSGLAYQLSWDKESYIVTGLGTATDTDIVIPSVHYGLPVTGIEVGAFKDCSSLTSIVIPDSIISIGSAVFQNCSSLQSMTIPFVGATQDDTTYYTLPYFFGGSGSVCVPASLKEVIITGGEKIPYIAFFGCSNITSIVLPSSITSIVDQAFSGCSSLTNVEIPATVKTIGKEAFRESGLLSITIPSAVESIGERAFSDCNDLTAITIEGETIELGNNVFYNSNNITKGTVPTSVLGKIPKTNLQELIIQGGEEIWGYTVTNCSNLTSVVIGDSVTSIEEGNFNSCNKLTKILLPDGLKSIGVNTFAKSPNIQYNEHDNAFYLGSANNPYMLLIKAKDKTITSCSINENTRFICEGAFQDCYSLTNIVIPDSVLDIGYKAFCGAGLTNIVMGHNVERIAESAFNSTLFSSITLPNTLKSIGKEAFSFCSNLQNLEIPDSVTSIGDKAFNSCSKLESVVLGNGLTDIGEWCFYGSNKLETMFIGSNLTNVGDYAFSANIAKAYYEGTMENWIKLKCPILAYSASSNTKQFFVRNENQEWEEVTSIEIPEGITEIVQDQFKGFKNVTSVTIPSSVTSIGNAAFFYCSSLENVYYEGSIEDWCNISFDVSSNPVSFAKHFYMRNANQEWEEVTSIEIPEGVTEIGDYQFYQFANITSVTIPNSVTSIGNEAFYKCSSLASITMSNSITSIGFNAFRDCGYLTSIVIPNSVTSIGASAFYGCYKLVEVYNLSNLTITAESTDNGYVGFYAKVIHTSLEEQSSFIEKDDYVFIKDNNNSYYLVSYKGTETELVLPNDIDGNTYEINDYAFNNCRSLTSIVIPKSVTCIGLGAFFVCSNLKEVYYAGTLDDWDSMRIEPDNPTNFYASIYFYSETQPIKEGNYWHYVDGVITKW